MTPFKVPESSPRETERSHDPSWSASYPGGGSVSTSLSGSYDYSGQDAIHKAGDDLSQSEGARRAAIYSGDIGAALALGRRIADLKGYIDAYKASGGAGGYYDGVYGEVMPRSRASSQSTSAAVSQPSGGSYAQGGRVLELS